MKRIITSQRTTILFAASLFLWMGAMAAQAEENWVSLIPKEGMETWREGFGTWMNVGKATAAPDGSKKIETQPGGGVLVNGPDGHTENLFSKAEHGDVEARIEFMVPPQSNSGIYFQGRYELQILDSWGVAEPTYGDCGGIYQRWKDEKGYEGHAPGVNASKRPGEWQTFEVWFRAPRFDTSGKKTANAKFVKVLHNGKVVHENIEVTGPTRAAAFEDEQPQGPLMIQGDHGPVAIRKFDSRELKAGD